MFKDALHGLLLVGALLIYLSVCGYAFTHYREYEPVERMGLLIFVVVGFAVVATLIHEPERAFLNAGAVCLAVLVFFVAVPKF
ncbi:hypothetical protein A2765_01430 [Candidatus Kaiserbacteria bacterium RIFCSPHIGHO2_01_FULL_56_24]|uniref:Uncharacterized protein n=1 Tax=Candidatus Kaiserbacteria bacterium RIFCSPHIGHO2_01_FULL_56_24 TaxID=1798487 RepID=A0A1F6DH73_9BACT|nr:MAG: hypothetical protein A2765_01430 [Candidatus Kaiserbacteria bacterium RIFCSPHIGHO2_01_FULL_56_24]